MFFLSFFDSPNWCVYPKVSVADESVHVPEEALTDISRNLWECLVIPEWAGREKSKAWHLWDTELYIPRSIKCIAFDGVVVSTNLITILFPCILHMPIGHGVLLIRNNVLIIRCSALTQQALHAWLFNERMKAYRLTQSTTIDCCC